MHSLSRRSRVGCTGMLMVQPATAAKVRVGRSRAMPVAGATATPTAPHLSDRRST